VSRKRLSLRLTSSPRWTAIWRGRGPLRRGLVKFVWVFARLWITTWLWGTAVRLAHFEPPLKTIGVALAIASLGIGVWALIGLWQGLRILGLKRLMIILLVVFIAFVTVNVLTTPDERPIAERFVGQVAFTGVQWLRAVLAGAQGVVAAPDEFLFAYTGERLPPQPPPGFATPDPQAEPVRAVAQPGGRSIQPAALRVNQYARVANTDGQPLRGRAEPGTATDIVVRFPEGTRLLISDGPISKDGITWWKVRGAQGEAWCADQWLTPDS
jgi:hypothetical protein